jgi:EAL domain-containing protein (putative c-di-GMP-specific phosphodiesterase class I)/GGDEF domain-containing protein
VPFEELPTYDEHLPLLAAQIEEHGCIGLMVIDASAFGAIESEYGHSALQEVRGRAFAVIREHQGRDCRQGDLWTLDRPGGLRLLVFLERKRRKNVTFSTADFRAIRARLLANVVPNLVRGCFPYLKDAPRVDVVHGLALYNPLVHTQSVIRRVLDESHAIAAHLRQAEILLEREKLQELIVHERVVTAFQPIMLLKDRTVLGYEALSRGARGTALETADELFGAAERQHLTVELDRLCRRRALLCAGRVPSNARLFVNTLPATIRDPQFRGKPLIDFLGRAQVSPDRIVLEITEKLVIDNYAMFREAMQYFVDLGMSFAVDDVGTGYSGLELIARLNPHFLKIDMSLVRDVHTSVVNRAMVKAIVALSHAIGATVIAEGIHSQDESTALEQIGVDFGQGFFLARPDSAEE